MHAAWTERDVKQRLTDVEMKELNHQVAQGRLYTQLATSRITELSAEIEPIKKAKTDAVAHIAQMEALQASTHYAPGEPAAHRHRRSPLQLCCRADVMPHGWCCCCRAGQASGSASEGGHKDGAPDQYARPHTI